MLIWSGGFYIWLWSVFNGFFRWYRKFRSRQFKAMSWLDRQPTLLKMTLGSSRAIPELWNQNRQVKVLLVSEKCLQKFHYRLLHRKLLFFWWRREGGSASATERPINLCAADMNTCIYRQYARIMGWVYGRDLRCSFNNNSWQHKGIIDGEIASDNGWNCKRRFTDNQDPRRDKSDNGGIKNE
jgi:hypothetical protein